MICIKVFLIKGSGSDWIRFYDIYGAKFKGKKFRLIHNLECLKMNVFFEFSSVFGFTHFFQHDFSQLFTISFLCRVLLYSPFVSIFVRFAGSKTFC